MTLQGQHAEGKRTFAALVPGGEERLGRIFSAAPALEEMAVGTVYGHLHHRPALDPRTREAVALAAILAAGMHGTPLAVHLRTALASGLSAAEVAEVLLETAAFAGFPRAVGALAPLEEALEESGIAPPPPPAPREVALKALRELRTGHAPHHDAETWQRTLHTLLLAHIEPRVLTVGPTEALALFGHDDREGGPAALAHIQVDGDSIEAVHVKTGPGSGRIVPDEHGSSPSAALAQLLDDVRVGQHGPAEAYLRPDPELLDQLQPVRPLLKAGVRPHLTDVDPTHAAAVFPDLAHGPTLLVARLHRGAITHITVMRPDADAA